MINKKIIIALDGMSVSRALKIAKLLSGKAWGFKVNDLLHNPKFQIKNLKKYGHVFIDAKLHDTPNTVFNSVRQLSRQGVEMITVHASGGFDMMKSAKQAALRRAQGKTKIIAVTVLTSIGGDVRNKVLKLARDAQEAGVDGIVCSAHELKYLKNIKPINKIQGGLLKIVPGIRPSWYGKKDDQKRSATPKEALRAGADYLVIGRPITQAKDPVKALASVNPEKE